jgi:hypothetical protein
MRSFSEMQRLVGSPWVWVGIAIAAVSSAVVPFALANAEGAAATAGTIAGAASLLSLLAFFTVVQLRTSVGSDGVRVQVFPLMKTRRIPYGEIRCCWARTYRPIREYGGWGIRGLGSNRAYNMRGNEGVQLELVDGRRILIGSQRAGELAAAIRDAALRAGCRLAGAPKQG